MSEVEVPRTSTVPQRPAAVWAVLAEFDRIDEWAPDVTHAALTTEPPMGLGAARRVQVGRQALIETITTWEPGSTLAYRIDGLPPLVKGVTNRWTLAPAGDGTLITLTSIIDTGGSLRGRLASRVLAPVLGKASVGMLGGLASHLASPTGDAR